MVTIDELTKLDRSKLTKAADAWSKVSNRASVAMGRVEGQMLATLRGTQEGDAAKASLKQLTRLSKNYQYIHAECGLIRTALSGLAEELEGPQNKLKQALKDAADLKFTVNPDGSVKYPPTEAAKVPFVQQPARAGGLPLMAKSDPNQAKAQDIADRIATAIQDANGIDGRYAKALKKLNTNGKLDQTDFSDVALDLKDVQSAARKYASEMKGRRGKSPKENLDWWTKKSQEEKEKFITLFPDQIGYLDGLPSMVRDRANRDYLPMLMGELEGQSDEKSATMLKGLLGIDEKLKKGSVPPMLLLGIGDQGEGRAIVSYGNPDTSRNVSVYVPGLGTKLNEDFADGGLNRAFYTADGARVYDKSTASIVWLGYDAPQSADVMGKGRAEAGAPAYQSFLQGIRATNENPGAHVTAIGHSYGSLTLGRATQRTGGLPVDDIVLVGSPGTGVDKAEDLGVGKDHVYVGSAQNDPVTWLPSKQNVSDLVFGGLPRLAGKYIAGEILGKDDDQLWFGRDPADKGFGAQRFKVDDGPIPLLDGEGLTPAHSNYFNPHKDKRSADNIAAVVAGRPDLLVPEKPR
ncbi:alpha/beta hydrolase [Streptomyces sp. NPDC051162]|uniref:alpha/beta hydrolase n=1 Tax=Streptomyces sp. NPDC051162 TaxID=3154747 RepID=UPI003433BD24